MTDASTLAMDDAEAELDESIRELIGERSLDQPIELLVQLAEDGDIDPWDIDLLAVTDAFLDRIDDADLIVTARTLFYASVLLRMKSEELAADPEREPTPERPPEPAGTPESGDPVSVLEAEMDRRLTRKRTRGTPATLTELIHELRTAEREQWWKSSRTYDTSGGRRGQQTLDYRPVAGGEHASAGIKSVSDTSHEESLEAELDPIVDVLEDRFEAAETITLDDLVEMVEPTRARVYRALVFLEDSEAVRLEQDRLYAPLTVTPGDQPVRAGWDENTE